MDAKQPSEDSPLLMSDVKVGLKRPRPVEDCGHSTPSRPAFGENMSLLPRKNGAQDDCSPVGQKSGKERTQNTPIREESCA